MLPKTAGSSSTHETLKTLAQDIRMISSRNSQSSCSPQDSRITISSPNSQNSCSSRQLDHHQLKKFLVHELLLMKYSIALGSSKIAGSVHKTVKAHAPRRPDHQQLKKILKSSRAWKQWKSITTKFSQDRQSFEEEEVERRGRIIVLFFFRLAIASLVFSQQQANLCLSLIEKKQTSRITKQNPTNILHSWESSKSCLAEKKTPTICRYNEWVCAAAPALPATSNKVRYTQGPYHEFNINNWYCMRNWS